MRISSEKAELCLRRTRWLGGMAFTLTIATTTVFGTAPQSIVPPPVLTDEVFVSTPDIVANCDVNGISTIWFTVTGTATGPYPGTFTESGTVRIGPQTQDPPPSGHTAGPLVTFDSVFTIDSPMGQVTGTRWLEPIPGVGLISTGQCHTVHNSFFNMDVHRDAAFSHDLAYRAVIRTPDGEFSDRGRVPFAGFQRVRSIDLATDAERLIFIEFLAGFDSEQDATELIEPNLTPGLATGGGQIQPDVTFGFNARSDGTYVEVNCSVVDKTADTKVKCLTATMYVQNGAHATFRGSATVNGVVTTYVIEVDDIAEPGIGTDRFAITTATGYRADGVLNRGNIQVHR